MQNAYYLFAIQSKNSNRIFTASLNFVSVSCFWLKCGKMFGIAFSERILIGTKFWHILISNWFGSKCFWKESHILLTFVQSIWWTGIIPVNLNFLYISKIFGHYLADSVFMSRSPILFTNSILIMSSFF